MKVKSFELGESYLVETTTDLLFMGTCETVTDGTVTLRESTGVYEVAFGDLRRVERVRIV